MDIDGYISDRFIDRYNHHLLKQNLAPPSGLAAERCEGKPVLPWQNEPLGSGGRRLDALVHAQRVGAQPKRQERPFEYGWGAVGLRD